MAKDVIVNLKINGVNQAITNFDQLEASIKDLETQLKQATLHPIGRRKCSLLEQSQAPGI